MLPCLMKWDKIEGEQIPVAEKVMEDKGLKLSHSHREGVGI